MPKRHPVPLTKPALKLIRAAGRLPHLGMQVCRSLRRWHRRRIPVEVVIADRSRRSTLGRELTWGLRRLRRILGDILPSTLAVVAQQVIATDHQLAGCYQVGQRPDGTRFALIRLALQVNGRRLTTDELLAVLAEQCIALATQGSGPSVLVPIDLEPAPAHEAGQHPPRPADPLAPSPNGVSRLDRPGPGQRGA